jgi:Smg protein
MFDILVYLFENYYQAQAYPDYDTLERKLHAAGFENDDIQDALDWLNSLTRRPDEDLPESLESLDTRSSFRGYTADESSKLPLESRGFIAFLEGAKILTPLLRELIIERAMALPSEVVGLDKLKVIVLMVLWTRRGNVDALVLDELIPDGEARRTH